MSLSLNREQLDVVRDLVGAEITKEDLEALETAYSDFRAGMDSLEATFAKVRGAKEHGGKQ